YGPWGEHTAFVRTPESFHQILHTPGYDFRSQRSLMTSLEVDTVAAAAESLLRSAAGAAP
ncbi:MAG: glycosyltransferase family 9 protein, partial [Proteobacteria bacterium]|nr:glycosyltransferase family 9 protein [Pseudomonadota bacterium]